METTDYFVSLANTNENILLGNKCMYYEEIFLNQYCLKLILKPIHFYLVHHNLYYLYEYIHIYQQISISKHTFSPISVMGVPLQCFINCFPYYVITDRKLIARIKESYAHNKIFIKFSKILSTHKKNDQATKAKIRL